MFQPSEMRFQKLNLPYQPYLNKTTSDDDILYRVYSCFSYAAFLLVFFLTASEIFLD